MGNDNNDDPNTAEKAGIGILFIFLWCSTGGLMLLHFISFFTGATNLLFFAIGFFIPPVGLINGLVFIVTGDSFQQYF